MKLNFNSRKFKYGSASTLFVIVFIALVIVVNVFAGFLTDRFSLKLDLTESGQFTLSEQTKDMLGEVNEDINIYILSTRAEMEKNQYSKNALEMIQRYGSHSGGRIRYEFIDPNKNPQFFDKYPKARNCKPRALVIEGPKRYTVVESQEFAYTISGSKSNKIYYESEEKLSAAIMYVSSDEVSSAGFVTGHNETEVPALLDIFEGNNFETASVDLLSGIPEGINNLVIAAPTADFSVDEISALESFLARDGSCLYVFWSISTPKLPVLERYLAEWGFEFPTYLVCDESSSYMSEAYVIAELTENDVVDKELQGQLMAISPLTRPVNITFTEKSYMRTLEILRSAKTSYGKLLSADSPIKVLGRESGDIKGPFTVAAIGERALGTSGTDGISRVAVFGTSGFASSEMTEISRSFNNTLLTRVVDYANPNTLTMQIMPKVVSSYDLNITEAGTRVVQIILVYIIPILILAAGVFMFIRRKNR